MRQALRGRVASVPLTLVIAFTSFLALGLPVSLLGVAWPSVRETFALPLDAMGAMLLAVMAGNVAASFSSGALSARLGFGMFLMLSCAVLVVGLMTTALAPAWWVMLLGGAVSGVGFGALNSGVNTYLATHYGSRLMNLLHASFGLGATAGPLVLTALMEAGFVWRWGWALVGVVQMVFVACFALTRDRWRVGDQQPRGSAASARGDGASVTVGASWRETLALPLMWIGIGLFFASTGVQAAAGQWSYTLFTEGRGVDTALAGVWAGMYWGMITLARVFFGIVGDRLRFSTLLRLSIGGLIVGAALIWVNLSEAASFLGLAVMGLAAAPIYPLLVLTVPRQLGTAHAANGIGFQIAAGSLGGALVPALAGVLAERAGLETIGPFMAANAALMLLLHESSRRVAARSAPPHTTV